MTVWARLLLALTLLLERIGDYLEARARKREAERQAAEIERLRNETVQWWQDNFGVADTGGDSRLPDAAEPAPDASPASARDRRD